MRLLRVSTTVAATLVGGCDPSEAPRDGGGDAPSPPAADARVDAAAALDATPEEADAYVGSDASMPDAATQSLEAIVRELESCDPARFDRAMHEVAWGGGWPLAGEGRWLFATRFDGVVGAARVVGDLGDWDTARWPATRCGDGRRFFVVVDGASTTAPALGSKYKWFVVDDGSYRAPDEATQYGYDEFGRFGWVRAPADVAHLEQFPAFASAHLAQPRTFRAYLPAGFVAHGASAGSLRTLLLHDGQNVFHPDAFFGGWRVDETLAARGADVVALAIDNASDRMDAYTPVTDDLGSGPIGGRADDYLALIAEEALPFFRARYGVVAAGASLMVAGSSLGGLVTLHAAQRDLADMGCGAALSSTVGWGSIAASARGDDAIVERWTGLHAPLYLDSGGSVRGACADLDGDGVEDDSDDSDNYCVNLQMLRVLEGAGYVRGVSLEHVWATGAAHNEAAWAERFGGALDACERMGWRAP